MQNIFIEILVCLLIIFLSIYPKSFIKISCVICIILESGRKKRKTAKNAEEIIRKKYLNSESSESDEEEYVIISNINKNLRPASPPSLKRNCLDNENSTPNGAFKKVKMSVSPEKTDVTKLTFVENMFHRDVKDELTKFTQEVTRERKRISMIFK